MAAIGVLSVALAFMPSSWARLSGFAYFLIGPVLAAHGFGVGRRRLRRALAAEAPAPPEAPEPAAATEPAPTVVGDPADLHGPPGDPSGPAA